MINIFRIGLAIVILTISTLSKAQIAIRGGVNIANNSITAEDASVSFSDRIGFHAGLMAEFAMSEKLTFRPGLLYSQRGNKIEILGLVSLKMNLNYIDIPLSFTYGFSGRKKGFFVELGPNIQYLLSATGEADGESEDIKDDFKPFDIGLLIGLGYKINSKLSIGLNYNAGLINILEASSNGESMKNTNIGIYASYAF